HPEGTGELLQEILERPGGGDGGVSAGESLGPAFGVRQGLERVEGAGGGPRRGEGFERRDRSEAGDMDDGGRRRPVVGEPGRHLRNGGVGYGDQRQVSGRKWPVPVQQVVVVDGTAVEHTDQAMAGGGGRPGQRSTGPPHPYDEQVHWVRMLSVGPGLGSAADRSGGA